MTSMVCHSGVSAPIRENSSSATSISERADDREDPVAAGAGDDLPGDDRAGHDAEHERDQLQAALGRRGALHDLQVQRQQSAGRRTCAMPRIRLLAEPTANVRPRNSRSGSSASSLVRAARPAGTATRPSAPMT